MKKLLNVGWIFIIIGVIVIIRNSHIFETQDSKAIAAGEKVYNQQCVVCHGKTGKGEGTKVGTAINNQNFLSAVSDMDLYNYVKYGRKGTAMPAYGLRLSEKDLTNLVAFIKKWQTNEINYGAPKDISGNLKNGAKLYKLYCLSCHGEAGAGKSKMGTALSNPQYLKYTTNQQIWIGAAYGREDTRMSPSLKGLEGVRQLKKDDITNIVTYIRSLQEKREK
jgi:cytochrome c oxidase cbb3-type subunit III